MVKAAKMPPLGTHLRFGQLRYHNTVRCLACYHPLDEWSLCDWATAAAGEMGEVCGVVKKARRLGHDDDSVLDNQLDLVSALSDEIADVVIYLDLLASRAGIDLGAAVQRKFNQTSDKVGYEARL